MSAAAAAKAVAVAAAVVVELVVLAALSELWLDETSGDPELATVLGPRDPSAWLDFELAR